MNAPQLYFDNAATSCPKPPEVRAAVLRYLDDVGASAGRGAYREAREAGAILDRCRAALARLLNGGRPEQVVFTLNCTDALNLGLKGCLRDGDHVVTTWMDHNSILRPLHHLEERGLVSVTRVRASPVGVVDPLRIREAITPKTRLVAMLHGSNVAGSLQPVAEVAEICRSRGVLLLVDAAQTLGTVPIDVRALGVDLLAFPCHKGLMGPTGTGGLWISERVDLRPLREGGTGSKSEDAVQPPFLPDRYEAGSHNLLGIAGLLGALEFIGRMGIESIAAHKRMLIARFLEGFAAIPGIVLHGPRDPARKVAVFSISVPGADPLAFGRRLDDEAGVKVRSGLHCAPFAHRTLGTWPGGTVRFSPGFFTTAGDVDAALDAVRRLAPAGRHAEAGMPVSGGG